MRKGLIIFVLVFLILISSGCTSLLEPKIETSYIRTDPRIVIEPESHNFQDVSVAGGVVKTVMAIKNLGKSDLVIDDMDSSCGCTTASVTKDKEEGPVFGMRMHGTNPVGWSETLKSGETAELNIYYDPRVHSELRGPVTRVITVFSNDPNTPNKIVKIEVRQVD